MPDQSFDPSTADAARHGPLPGGARLAWLDGVRGVAALQVVLLHQASAFWPGLGLKRPDLAHAPWENAVAGSPLFFVLDGYAAVYLFFLLSGVALSYSFARHSYAIPAAVLRRVIRLGLPMAAAIGLGLALLWLMPRAHVAAGALTGSRGWLGAVSPAAPNLGMAAHQVMLEGMIAGYRETSLLPIPWRHALHLAPLFDSLDAPLWTLHVEFFGSLLVMALAAARAGLPGWMHDLLCAAGFAYLAASPLELFVLGHAVAPRLRRPARGGAWPAGLVLLGVGVALSSNWPCPGLDILLSWLPDAPGPFIDPFHFRNMVLEIFVLAGLALTPRLQGWLAHPVARRLGALSFGLYLVHFPVLFTGTSLLFLHARLVAPYDLAAGISALAGILASFLLAIAFERWIDRPAIALSRRLGGA